MEVGRNPCKSSILPPRIWTQERGSSLHRGSLDQGKNIECLMIDGFGTYYFVHCTGEFVATGYVLKGFSCIYVY